MTLRKKPFESIVGIRENAGNQHFLFFPQCFLPFPKQISIFDSHLNCRLQMPSTWTGLKLCCLEKGLKDELQLFHFAGSSRYQQPICQKTNKLTWDRQLVFYDDIHLIKIC